MKRARPDDDQWACTTGGGVSPERTVRPSADTQALAMTTQLWSTIAANLASQGDLAQHATGSARQPLSQARAEGEHGAGGGETQ